MRSRLHNLLLLAPALLAGCGGSFTPVHTPFNKGVYLYSKGSYAQAVDEYRLALEEDSEDYRARFNLGMALEAWADRHRANGKEKKALELDKQAEQAYLRILEQKPGNVRASVNLAAMQYARGDTDAAKQRLEELAEAHGDVMLPLTALAAHLIEEKDFEGAEEALKRATDIDAGSIYGWYLLGRVRAARKEWDPAREAYGEALEREPYDIATLAALGELEIAAGRPQEARSQLQGVLLIDPEHYRAHALLAMLAEEQGKLEEAVLHHLLAREVAPRPALTQRHGDRLHALYQRLAAGRQ